MVDWLDDAQEIATVTARRVHRRYHTYFDVADVVQELWIWLTRHEDKVSEWLGHEPDTDEYKIGVKKLGKTLNRQADKYCRRIKAQKSGYELRDEQFYSPVTVAELLPYAWKEVVDSHDSTKPKVSGTGNPAEGGNYIVQLFDVRNALAKLGEYDRDVLELKYGQQLTFRELADELEVTESTAHRRVDRATRNLVNLLGGANPYGKGEVSG